MDLVAIVDLETTGLDWRKDDVIEIAVVRYSLKRWCVADARSALVGCHGNPAEAVNRIPAGMLADFGMDEPDAWLMAEKACSGCAAILAHNAEFDRAFVPYDLGFKHVKWIDTCQGIDWPRQSKPASSLIHLALDHGLGVVDPHRALNDCLLLARLLTHVADLGYDADAMLAKGLRPMAEFRALVPYEDRDKAKDAGFKWDADRKEWRRRMAVEDALALPFPVKQLHRSEPGPEAA